MAHVFYNKDGKPMTGDRDLSDALKGMADIEPGSYVVDDSTGEKVYEGETNTEE